MDLSLEIGIFDEANARRFPSKQESAIFFLSFRVRMNASRSLL